MDTITRLGIFYDGNFFLCVSNYYAYHHPRKARISISGLHEFARKRAAHEEQVDPSHCQLVEKHHFQGRFKAEETNAAGKLLDERRFDDVLEREGVTRHPLPMGYSGTEKGIDVSFALEAYDLASKKCFDVCVLVTGDTDFVPLARKLNSLGTRVMVLGWDFEYTDQNGRERTTKTSQALLNEVSYPVLVSSIIEDKTQKDVLKELFLRPRDTTTDPPPEARNSSGSQGHGSTAERHDGAVQNVLEDRGFAYITPAVGGPNVWFGEHELVDGVALSTLSRGDAVTFETGTNREGTCAKRVRVA